MSTSARISSTAFAEIMYVGNTGNAPGTTGNTEASTTLSLFTPRTRNLLSNTAIGSSSEPIAHVDAAWCEYACNLTNSRCSASVQFPPPVPGHGCNSLKGRTGEPAAFHPSRRRFMPSTSSCRSCSPLFSKKRRLMSGVSWGSALTRRTEPACDLGLMRTRAHSNLLRVRPEEMV